MTVQGMNSHCNYGNYCCHDSRNKELVDTLPIIAGDGPETSSINQSEDDHHYGGQEETRGS